MGKLTFLSSVPVNIVKFSDLCTTWSYKLKEICNNTEYKTIEIIYVYTLAAIDY